MKSSKILVTGGAGYIGSHMVRVLIDAGFGVVTVDNLSGGYRDAVSGGDFVQGDIADSQLICDVIAQHRVTAVMHFASFIQVGESVNDPGKYYRNNLANTVLLLESMRACRVNKFIF